MPAVKSPANPSAAEHLLDLYRMMTRIRAFENAAEETSRGGVAVFGSTADPVKRVGAPRIPVGYARTLEDVARISAGKLLDALKRFVERDPQRQPAA